MTTRFTKEQIQQARQADLFAYLQANEPGVLKKDGRNYRHREHDSLVYVTAKNFWYWNSRGKSITALDYLMEIRGYSFAEAVSRLIGDAPARASPQATYSQNDSKPKQQRPAKLYLPWPKKCATGYFKYLRKRGISAKVIQRCRELGLLYEGKYKPRKDEKIVPVCVFVGKDEAGKIKFACMRGIYEQLKKDVYGSDKAFSFCLPPEKPHSSQVPSLKRRSTRSLTRPCRSLTAGSGTATAFRSAAPRMLRCSLFWSVTPKSGALISIWTTTVRV